MGTPLELKNLLIGDFTIEKYKNLDSLRSAIFMPERISFNSKDDNATTLNTSDTNGFFNSFKINLRNPILGAKSLDLTKTTIPIITTNLPNTELVFWYYKLPTQVEIDYQIYAPQSIDIKYLHCVRILPSYYSKDVVSSVCSMPINRYYNSYQDLLTDLNLACNSYNGDPNPYIIPNDISFSFDDTTNKFSVNYNNIYNAKIFVPGTTYHVNDIVQYVGRNYVCLVSTSNSPSTSPSFWYELNTNQPAYYYLPSGANDPNIIIASQNLLSATTGEFSLEGIIGQPFINNRSLNNRLGYSWSPINSNEIDYINHLRPIPNYIYNTSLLYNINTLTANSYGNLVYSQNVNIYLTITGGSAYSSESGGTPNFLLSVPLNTTPLGVSYFNNTQRYPLTKIPNEIYEFTFIFTTDTNQPFLFPNIENISLEMGFSYN